MKTIVDVIVRMALDNPSWGYTRIRGALANLGHQVGRGTIANILRDNGIEPAPERDAHPRWSKFLKAHWECLAVTDFLSVEVCTMRGLVTQYVLFFIDIASRRAARPSQAASATRRNAQLLLPRSSLTSLDSVSGHYDRGKLSGGDDFMGVSSGK
jgi:hypothetical protein